MNHFRLEDAHLCLDCSAISAEYRACPACASSALMPLAPVLDRTTDPELAAMRTLQSIHQAIVQCYETRLHLKDEEITGLRSERTIQ